MGIRKSLKFREAKNRIYSAMRIIPDRAYIKLMFWARVGKWPDLNNPETYNEKLQWMKMYDRNPYYCNLVDKYKAREIAGKIIGEEYLVPSYGVWDKFDDIDFDSLPEKFVIKCTHDSGGIVICQDKKDFDKKEAKKRITNSLRLNYFWIGREWPYKNLSPRIIVEQYLEDTKHNEVRDYKFFCFDGRPKLMYIATNRQGKSETYFDFFDMDGNHLDIVNAHSNAPVIPDLPCKFEEMKLLAEKLSTGLKHVRIDFYEVNGKVFFGEFTLFHMSGFRRFIPDKWDRIIGDWLNLS
ncbi:ATP-grasp fold amidoligase family protein [Butyrivibrio hungatei]|uniref:TupA-like ATPgrasp polysaccharide biosynthesis protein n=1 Tax=Butyrivibrio hungatei TaxID=185008 RepID=A0A1D9P3C5_9FIRM|nr:ATP-grasp fold amidoligase family protein [Butyrivibrio hungatei]AOZ97019.1 TupA-like ATPgrasp polysaccharide biosynthesis protein [Butyrivibrio hungatei]